MSPYAALLKQMREVVEHIDRQTSFDNGEARKMFDECARQIELATAVHEGFPPRPVYRVGGHVFKIEPTSCACGGSFAWLRERPSGAWEMVGCICHTTLTPPMKQGETP